MRVLETHFSKCYRRLQDAAKKFWMGDEVSFARKLGKKSERASFLKIPIFPFTAVRRA